jgi:hypothetical protein
MAMSVTVQLLTKHLYRVPNKFFSLDADGQLMFLCWTLELSLGS